MKSIQICEVYIHSLNGPTNVDFDREQAANILAEMMYQSNKKPFHGRKFYYDRVICCDIPAMPGTNRFGYSAAVQCIANSGESYNKSGDQIGYFSPFEFEDETYLYQAKNGDWMLAVIPDDGETRYYRVQRY